MFNNDVFGARPKLNRTPIISETNPLYDAFESERQALLPVTPSQLNSVETDIQNISSPECSEFFHGFEEKDLEPSAPFQEQIYGLVPDKNQTKIYTEIEKKLRSYSGYEEVQQLIKTPPRKQWANRNKKTAASVTELSRGNTSFSPKSTFSEEPIVNWTNRITRYVKKIINKTNGRPIRHSDTQVLSGRTRGHTLDLSNLERPTPNINLSFEELRRKKDRFSSKQSTNLDAIDSVDAGYSGVEQQTNADRPDSNHQGIRVYGTRT
jgi:hypothetical protein